MPEIDPELWILVHGGVPDCIRTPGVEIPPSVWAEIPWGDFSGFSDVLDRLLQDYPKVTGLPNEGRLREALAKATVIPGCDDYVADLPPMALDPKTMLPSEKIFPVDGSRSVYRGASGRNVTGNAGGFLYLWVVALLKIAIAQDSGQRWHFRYTAGTEPEKGTAYAVSFAWAPKNGRAVATVNAEEYSDGNWYTGTGRVEVPLADFRTADGRLDPSLAIAAIEKAQRIADYALAEDEGEGGADV